MRIWGCNDYVTYKQQDDSLGVSENWLASFKRKSDDKHYNWSTMKCGMPIFRQVHLVSFDDQYHASWFQLVWGWLWCNRYDENPDSLSGTKDREFWTVILWVCLTILRKRIDWDLIIWFSPVVSHKIGLEEPILFQFTLLPSTFLYSNH